MKWRPLLFRSPSRQPRQAIKPAQYSNLKRVRRLRATLYYGDRGSTVVKALRYKSEGLLFDTR